LPLQNELQEPPDHRSIVPTQLVVNEIYTLQQDIHWRQYKSSQYSKVAEQQISDMERQLKSKAIEIDRYSSIITGLTRERDRLLEDNDCLFKDNELLQEENIRLKSENKRPSSVDKHKHTHVNIFRKIEDDQNTLLEKYLKMKNETVPELRRLNQQGRSICSPRRYAL